jgi:hypothetical protein
LSGFFLEFLTRPQCHLCRDAELVVRRVARLVGASVVEVDVDRHPDLAVDFGLRIPVVRSPGGAVLGEGRLAFGHLLFAAVRARLR